MKLTAEDRQRIKAQHPDAIVMKTKEAPEYDFVFKRAKLTEFDAFLAALNGGDETEKLYAHRSFARDLVVFPEVAAWDAFAVEKPGLAHTFGFELQRHTGLNADVQVDAL